MNETYRTVTAAEAETLTAEAARPLPLRVAGAGIISGGVLVNKIIEPSYPGRYGLRNATYDALLRSMARHPAGKHRNTETR